MSLGRPANARVNWLPCDVGGAAQDGRVDAIQIVTLVIAVLGLVIAAMSFVWQVVSFSLQGRRVRVSLVHGVQGYAGMAVGAIRRSGRPNDIDQVRGEGFTGEEIIGVRVTNVGRLPVTISRYSARLVDFGMAAVPVGGVIGPALPHRLEPGDSEDWYVTMQHAAALVHATRAIRRISDRVRMTVELGTGDEIRTKRWLHATPERFGSS